VFRRAFDRVQWLWRYERSLTGWGRLLSEAAGPVDVWHAHDLTGLQAVAAGIPRSVPLVYDSHELFLETGTAVRLPGIARRFLRAREARLIRRCSAVITVNPGLAAVLERLYHPARIAVVRNCVPRWSPPPVRPNLIRTRLGLAKDAPIVLFHGSLEANRGIEQLVAALSAPGLADLQLVLLGFGEVPDAGAVADDPTVSHRVHVLAAVPPAQLPEWVASADVGVVLQQPANLNLRLSTPNKLYEAIAVGTPVIASDLPEIARIVRDDPDGPLGILCDPGDPDAIAAALRSLLDSPRTRLLEMRTRCLRAAGSRLNWEMEAEQLVGLYADLSTG
jgi:glycosyltransferase involved in cell wall biosynthesis